MQKISYYLNETGRRQLLPARTSEQRPVHWTILLRTPLDGRWSGLSVMDQEQPLAPALAACTEEERQQAMARLQCSDPTSPRISLCLRLYGRPVSHSAPCSAGLLATASGWLGW